jgi:hypothetical protein
MFGETESEEKDLQSELAQAQQQIKNWMESYHLNAWSNQENYVEVWIEKKALQGVFEKPCASLGVGLAPCKGYSSITFLYEASQRFEKVSEDKRIVLLYFGDYDPSGEDIPRAVKDNLVRMGSDVEVKRIALNPDLIQELRLPGVPPKTTDSRTRNWDGQGAVELDAVEPRRLQQMCTKAILNYFDEDLKAELEEREGQEREKYQRTLKKFVKNMKLSEDE